MIQGRLLYLLPAFLFTVSLHAESKVQRCLQEACTKLEAHARSEPGASFSMHSRRRVRVNDSGAIQVYVHVNEASRESLALLKDKGLQIEIVLADLKLIQGWLPYDKFAEVEALAVVDRVKAPRYGVARAGSVVTEGDALHFGPEVRGQGFDGSGITVGVISDGIDSIASAIASNDLPDDVQVAGTFGAGNEGIAMLEIVHDIAPGAALRFSSGNTTAQFINSITTLRTAGSKVIVDDIGFPDEPFFEDGIVAVAAKAAVDAGVLFISAAGNSAEQHFAAGFNSGGPQTVGGLNLNDVHDFGGGDFRYRVRIPPGSALDIVFQWDNQSGTSGDDYDIYLVSTDNSTILASGTDVQNGDDDSLEVIDFGPRNQPTFADLVINRASGSARRLKFFMVNGDFIDGFGTAAGSIFGHPAATGVVAVAAVNSQDPTASGLENFSSRGPVTIVFPTLEIRNKPEVTGIDNVAVTGAGGFPSPFSGTSAAAPHIAAVAALLLDANPNLVPNQIAALLANNATDFGASGFDPSFGSGLVHAENSLTALLAGNFPDPVAPDTSSGSSSSSGGGGGGGGCGAAGPASGGGDKALMALMLSLLFYGGWRVAKNDE